MCDIAGHMTRVKVRSSMLSASHGGEAIPCSFEIKGMKLSLLGFDILDSLYRDSKRKFEVYDKKVQTYKNT